MQYLQLFSSNVALIICYQYHIKIEKRSEIKAHTVIVMSYSDYEFRKIVVLGIIVISENICTTNAEIGDSCHPLKHQMI